MEMYLKVLKNWQDFSSRADRKEFWTFVGINLAIGIILNIVDLKTIAALYNLVVLVPNVAVSVRRMHDTNRTGWWLLLCFTFIGGLVPLIFSLLPGQQQANKYGPVPGNDGSVGNAFNSAKANNESEDAKIEKVTTPENKNKES